MDAGGGSRDDLRRPTNGPAIECMGGGGGLRLTEVLLLVSLGVLCSTGTGGGFFGVSRVGVLDWEYLGGGGGRDFGIS